MKSDKSEGDSRIGELPAVSSTAGFHSVTLTSPLQPTCTSLTSLKAAPTARLKKPVTKRYFGALPKSANVSVLKLINCISSAPLLEKISSSKTLTACILSLSVPDKTPTMGVHVTDPRRNIELLVNRTVNGVPIFFLINVNANTGKESGFRGVSKVHPYLREVLSNLTAAFFASCNADVGISAESNCTFIPPFKRPSAKT